MQWRHGLPSLVTFLGNIVYKIQIVGFPSISKDKFRKTNDLRFKGEGTQNFKIQVT